MTARRRTHGFWAALIIATALAASGLSAGETTMFGVDLEADTFVWCLDRSASMGWALPGEELPLTTMQEEVDLGLSLLTPDASFSVLCYGTWVEVCMPTAVPATATEIGTALAFVDSIYPDGLSCMVSGLAQAMAIAATSGPNAAIILVSDGIPGCTTSGTAEEALDEIAAMNPTGIPIHAYGLSEEPSALEFFRTLAISSGGVFLNDPGPDFVRGDVNGDALLTVADAVYLLAYGFIIGAPEPVCFDAADLNDDGLVEPITDTIVLLRQLFDPTTPPPVPPITCGTDPSADLLSCNTGCP
ncbi:MAG: hypothetical protein KDC38_18110 [Planctomycetes bacterium]|nr:hypothetical protein [Planctomycetota bacterium]